MNSKAPKKKHPTWSCEDVDFGASCWNTFLKTSGTSYSKARFSGSLFEYQHGHRISEPFFQTTKGHDIRSFMLIEHVICNGFFPNLTTSYNSLTTNVSTECHCTSPCLLPTKIKDNMLTQSVFVEKHLDVFCVVPHAGWCMTSLTFPKITGPTPTP